MKTAGSGSGMEGEGGSGLGMGSEAGPVGRSVPGVGGRSGTGDGVVIWGSLADVLGVR